MTSDAEKCRLIATFEQFDGDDDPPHYEWDLIATMRAARKLPDEISLVVDSKGCVWLVDGMGSISSTQTIINDPARAAFDCLSAYLKERKP